MTTRAERWATDSARALAVMRITVAALWLALPEVWEAPALAPGGAARVAQVLVLGAAVAGLVGWRPRLAFAVITGAGLYLLGIPQRAGATVHVHHALWLAALLVAAPSDDALSVKAWDGPTSLAHGVPVRAAQLVLGCVYFFPGLHKLLAQGLWWDAGAVLAWKLAESPGFVPWFTPSDELLRWGGAAVVLFELSFLPLVWSRRTRPLAAALGLLFHGAALALFDIPFVSLWACYPILLPWGRGEWVMSRARGPLLSAVLVLAPVAAAGLSGRTTGWPFACYPTFAERPPDQIPGLIVEWEGEDGTRHEVPMEELPLATPRGGAGEGQRRWREAWALSGVGGPVDRPGLERLWERVAVPEARTVRFYRGFLDVRTRAWRRGPLLHTVTADGSRAPAAAR